MKQILSFILITIITGCSSSTIIKTEPEGADIYIDGVQVGKTPYEYTDIKPIFFRTRIFLSKHDYKNINVSIYKDEEFNPKSCLGLIITFPIWMFQYYPVHIYELELEDPGDNRK